MSRYYANYPQYLGAQRCCDLRIQGPQGPQGPTGANGGVGQRGWTGPIGQDGATGPTGAKSFIIQHPKNENKYLVHACLEGPEAGVYYRGKSEILNNQSITIDLPYYVDSLASDFTVNITPIFNGKLNTLNSSEVLDNKFTVYGENCKFYWIVYGKRLNIDVEPNKSETNVKGKGPYLYI